MFVDESQILLRCVAWPPVEPDDCRDETIDLSLYGICAFLTHRDSPEVCGWEK
jgi:hypothetical protein